MRNVRIRACYNTIGDKNSDINHARWSCGRVGAWEFAQVINHTVTSQQGECHIMLAANYIYCHEELVPINRIPRLHAHLLLVAELSYVCVSVTLANIAHFSITKSIEDDRNSRYGQIHPVIFAACIMHVEVHEGTHYVQYSLAVLTSIFVSVNHI